MAAVIRTRGYWHVIIRPQTFRADLISRTDLESVMRSSAVLLRGWDVPHFDGREPLQRGQDWIGREVNWEHHVELWRLYRSGQFVHLKGFLQDWRDQSEIWPLPPTAAPLGKSLGVTDALWTVGEYFELASRLSLALSTGVTVFRLRLFGLRDRELRTDERNRAPLMHRLASADGYDSGDLEFTADELVARGRSLAVEQAANLFAVFGWTPSEDLLRESLDELFSRR